MLLLLHDLTILGIARFMVTEAVVIYTDPGSRLWYFFIARWVQHLIRLSAFIGEVGRRPRSNFAYLHESAFCKVYTLFFTFAARF